MGEEQELKSEDFLKLSYLLRRNRSEEDDKKVREIMDTELPLEEKKSQIEVIDRLAREKKVRARFQQIIRANPDPRIAVNLTTITNDDPNDIEYAKVFASFTKILLIDDFAYITKTVSHILEKDRFKVFTAKNGVEGIYMFQKTVPQLVITDIRLPDINGFELASIIRKIDEEVPIILITAVDYDLKSYDLAKGKMAYLQKPIKRELLIETINQLLTTQD